MLGAGSALSGRGGGPWHGGTLFCEHSGNTDLSLNKRITERRELEDSAFEEVKHVWNGWKRHGPETQEAAGGEAHGVALTRSVGPTGVGYSSPRDTTHCSEQPDI